MSKNLRASTAQKLLESLKGKTPPLIYEPQKEYKEVLYPITKDFTPRFVFQEELISNVVQKTISYPLTKDIFGNWKEQKEKVTITIFHNRVITKTTRLTYTPPLKSAIFSRTKNLGIEFVVRRAGGTDHAATFRLNLYGHRPRYPTDYRSIHAYKTYEITTTRDENVFSATGFFSTDWPFSTIHVLISFTVAEAAHDPHYAVSLYFTFEPL